MIPDREYVFASSFIKASDAKGTPGERLARFREASDTASLRSAVSDMYSVSGDNVYDEVLCRVKNILSEALPDFSVMTPLFIKYDCTNIKIAIKCKLRGVSPEGLLFRCGTLDTNTILSAVESSDFKTLPPELGKAADEALTVYRKTGEVRAIDLTLDRACFEYMKKAADDGGCELIRNIVTVRADCTNLITAMRISAEEMAPDIAFSLFERAFVSGGVLNVSDFGSSENGLKSPSDIAVYANGVSAEAVKSAAKAAGPDEANRECDEAVLRMCDKFRYKSFGPEVAVRLLLIREAEMTNCRILEAAMGSEETKEKATERLRAAYV